MAIATSIGAPPTKIDVVTGSGVPGGFEGASVKHPSEASACHSSALASIAAKEAALKAAIASGLSLPSVIIGDALNKLNSLKQSALNKLNVSSKAPDFKSKFKLPSAPKPSCIPDFASAGIPEIPKLPSVGG